MKTTEYGWVGKILFVDLTSGKKEIISTSNYVPRWIGGRALAAKLYWDEVPPDCGAFDLENRLIFASGPASGTLGAGASRTAIAAKAAETIEECYMFASTGGHWSAVLKFAGFDAVIVKGKAPEPVYICIHEGEVEILRAERLWGKTTSETDTEIRRLWGDKSRTMLIGPAGENLVRSAVIHTDLGHAAGLGGFGAVMGSKNLKAIVVRGNGGIKVARPKDLINFYDQYVRIGGKYGGPYPISSEPYHIFHSLGALKELGLSEEQIGKQTEDIDTRFNEVDSKWVDHWLGHEEIMAGTLKHKFEGCFTCPACCGLAFQAKDPTGKETPPKNLDVPMVSGQQCHEYTSWNEFEAAEFQGKRMGRSTILNWSSHQEMGINTSDMGYYLIWFKDAVRQGLLTSENTGLPLGDYNSPEFVGLKGYTYGITYRRNDFFKRLAEGQLRFLDSMAGRSEAWREIYEHYFYRPHYYACTWGHPPSEALDLIMKVTNYRKTANSPSEHFTKNEKQLVGLLPPAEIAKARAAVRAKFAGLFGPKSFDLPGEPKTFESKIPVAIFLQNMHMEMDSIMYCGWAGFPRFYSLWTPDHVGDPSVGTRMLSAVTGIDRTMEENVGAMETAFTLERAIRAREGQRREHDWYTNHVFEENKWTNRAEFDGVMDKYYKARGWNIDTGIPTRSKLEKLGLKDVADDLEKKYSVPLSP